MIGIVCGGRKYGAVGSRTDYSSEDEFRAACEKADAEIKRLEAILDAAVTKLHLDTIIEGAATGADRLSAEWAKRRGDISVIEVPADWSVGKSAGAARNQMMLTMLLRSSDDKAVIAFPGGNGTAHMVSCCEGANRTQDAKIRVIKIDF